jgi:hypothetical protein
LAIGRRWFIIARMRGRLALAGVLCGLAGAGAIVASAAPQANGLPASTDGYASWPKINRKPVVSGGAHDGVKNVFRSKARAGKTYPNGTVIVKSIAEPGAKGLPRDVAVMRKVSGKWQWVEYRRSGATYGVLAKGALCSGCHMQAKANDWVFTKG